MEMTAGQGRSPLSRALPEPLDRAVRQTLARYRAGSSRTVNWPPDTGIGVGNMFSFWLWAHHGRRHGLDHLVRATPAMEPWLQVFPEVRELVLEPGQVRLRDQRLCDWAQDFDKFPHESMTSFIEQRLLRGTRLPWRREEDAGVVTVNVRRGDYYAVPALRAQYGFDIASYVRRAMVGAQEQEPIRAVAVVSDDPHWCRTNLAFLADHGPVHHQDPTDGPVQNLAQLASARRLVLANSTFSYWGAYLSNAVHEENHHLVWAPDLHRRDIKHGKAFQLDPRWSVVPDTDTGVAE